ncbi:Protein kinase domain-containing protein [Mycena indigotica]|uniref:non-specific serine/threonine protein kinase n=1 Tax=Mycena indigotica TaxID=2126181 RepID=A0A8H6S5Z1_9AGAR|nr:Protein kinase domain-containing protein [Mycena indigotica]KAF7291910.1 Protein kinase domain-containing protein [Mycena indigotica]
MTSPKYPKVVGIENDPVPLPNLNILLLGYDLVQQIGGGGFARVFRAVNLEQHLVAACKFVPITPHTTDKERRTLEKEMRIHNTVKHVNCLAFIDACVVELKLSAKYIPGFYFLIELAAGGDLFDKIAPDVGVGDEVAHLYFNQLISGVDHIHKLGVVHRDLKPENILLDVTGTLKISDFGLAAVYMLKETGRIRQLTDRCGSLPYVAPELNGAEAYAAQPVDVWGVGVILYTLLAGNTPWDEPSIRSPEFVRYLDGEVFQEEPWSRFSPNALSLIQGLLTVEPKDRFTIDDAFRHPWCTRPSQLAKKSPATLAEALTESLRTAGDLDLAAPVLSPSNPPDDEDVEMLSAPHQTQFTQTLMLFSQTQSGVRYTPHLTRFYAGVPPESLLPAICEGLVSLGVQIKNAPPNGTTLRVRIGGQDARKEAFRGWVELDPFEYHGSHGTFCVMQRDNGNPISWRQLWRATIQTPFVEPLVLKKRAAST